MTNKKKPIEDLKSKNRWGDCKPAVLTREKINGKLSPRESLIHPDFPEYQWKYVVEAWKAKQVPGPLPDDCYQWLGANHRQGYPMFPVKRENDPDGCKSGNMNGQRLGAAIAAGKPLRKGEFAFATCHNIQCTNPAHLKFGTREDFVKNSLNPSRKRSFYRTTYDKEENVDFITKSSLKVIAAAWDITYGQASHLKLLANMRREIRNELTLAIKSKTT